MKNNQMIKNTQIMNENTLNLSKFSSVRVEILLLLLSLAIIFGKDSFVKRWDSETPFITA